MEEQITADQVRDRSIHEKLDAILASTEDTNRIIRSMRRNAMIGGILKFMLMVTIAIILYVTVINYLTPLLESFGNGVKIDPANLQNMIDIYRSQVAP